MPHDPPGKSTAPRAARPGAWRDRRVQVLSAVLVVVLVAVAVAWWGRRSSSSALAPPDEVDVALVEGSRPGAEVSFDAVPGADGYLVQFDGHAGSIRVAPADCDEGRCALRFDQLTAAGASAMTVTALGAGETSESSRRVQLPEWPASDEPLDEWSSDEPVPLVVTRLGAGGRPEYETEVVEAGDDIEARVDARVAELEAADGVVAVAVNLPLRLDRAAQQGRTIPEGVGTWQTLAWDYDSLPAALDGSGVTVAVIDASFQLDHPALQGADVGPIVNVGDPDAPNDEALEIADHGTAVTAMIVGQPDSGAPGVAPRATIRPYSIYTNDLLDVALWGDRVLVDALAQSIVQAVDDGVDVISTSTSFRCSGTGPHVYCPDGTLAPAIEYAESHGVLVVASAPNDGLGEGCDGEGDPDESNQDAWPALYDSVVAVGGARQDGDRFVCSPEREYVDTLAPGQALRVPTVEGYEVWSGTSFATPLVAGLAALVLQSEPNRSPAEVRSLLADATDDRGRVIPLDLMEGLGLLDEPTVTAQESALLAEAMVRDTDWPYRGAALPVDGRPEGSAAALLSEALGEPTATDPASWGGSQGPDDPRPAPGQGDAPEPPECWSGLYGLLAWEEEGAPLLAALYAREPLPLDTGETVPAGALLGYRAYRDSARVVMTDGVAIGGTQADLEAHYVDDHGRPYRGVEFLGDDGEFELVNVSSPSGGGRETSGALGPPFGRMSGQSDPDQDRVLERGAGSQCGLDVDLVSQLLGGEPPTDSDDGGRGGGGTDPGECAARIGIVLDASPSIVDAGAEGQVRDAATGVVDALAESGAEVRVSAFAGFPVSLTSGWVPLDDEEGRRLALQAVGSMAFEGQGTNWEAALMDLAGQGADVVVFVTDGNPNEYGVGITSSPSPDGTTDFDPAALAAGVSAAAVLRGQDSRIIAVGAGDVRADSLAQVAGPTEGEDYYVGGFGDLGASLSQIAADLCGRE